VDVTRFHWSRAAFANAALGSAFMAILFGWWAFDAWPDRPWLSILFGGLSVLSAAVTVGWLTATAGPALTISGMGVALYGRGLFHRPSRRREYPWSVIHRLRVEDGSGPRMTRRISTVNLHIDLEIHALHQGRDHPAIPLTFLAEPFDTVLGSIRLAATAANIELEVNPDVLAPGALRRPPVQIPRRPSG
jgi:hypothetical protein